jgi:hypothetical protein
MGRDWGDWDWGQAERQRFVGLEDQRHGGVELLVGVLVALGVPVRLGPQVAGFPGGPGMPFIDPQVVGIAEAGGVVLGEDHRVEAVAGMDLPAVAGLDVGEMQLANLGGMVADPAEQVLDAGDVFGHLLAVGGAVERPGLLA